MADAPRRELSGAQSLELARVFISRDPEVELANLDTLERFREFLLRLGKPPNPVGDELYAAFVDLSDDELETILEALLQNWADAFNEICARDRSVEEFGRLFMGLIDALLYMVARGFIQFDDRDRALLVPPEGPAPSAAVERAIAARIRAVQRPERLLPTLHNVVRGN